ncbi:glycosyltransferase [Arthrobacter sp. RT-1]|uniref:WecB/TagA/CpsF family glycosyltransferase n=1 Tax=Arthrobacter sp. RT-1 TaxID=2292263 RepID=UPI000E1EE6A7|nr:WecB/TagA/CpsF family glycosyltransferase [Arthrobacter sp. RT-1]RDV08111.1 glycosyltransferase [Arthrobacter sp. RT-1]
MTASGVQTIGHVDLLATTTEKAAHHLIQLALSGHSHASHVHLVNAYTVALAENEPLYRQALSGTALNLPDGKPVAWASALRRQKPHLTQVRGPTLFVDVFRLGAPLGLKHYLLGSTPEVLAQLVRELERRYPNVKIVGAESPPFRPLTQDELNRQDARISDSGAHIVWVGLGTPKQDFEVERLASNVTALPIAIGAAFDFIAGSKTEAPAWMIRMGLEWVFRLATEPRRLWRRYLLGNLLFIRAATRRPDK